MENNNNPRAKGMSNKLWLIIGILALVAIVVVLATAFREKEIVLVEEAGGPAIPSEIEVIDSGLVSPSDNNLEGAVTPVPGGNPVIDNQVVNMQGQPVRNDVRPMDINAPRQTGPVNGEDLSAEVIQLEISAAGFSPSEFSVEAGALVSLALTATDESNHVLRFRDSILNAIRIGVYGGETRAISFNAPTEPGEYDFYCDVPGHSRRGEVGKMIVR